MRRFELNEGTSNKFWQIQLDDTSLRISFGKIGSSGQTQLKKFDASDKAQAELDRLVKEKTKKGYVEVGAPSPSPSPLTEIDTAARAYQQAAPAPGSGRPFKNRSASDVFGKLHERMARLDKALAAGEKQATGSLAQLVGAARRAYAEQPAELDMMAEAAAYRLASPPRDYRDDHGGELYARYWVAKAGGEFALRALAKAGGLSRKTDSANAWSEPTKLYVADEPHTELVSWGKSDDAWLPIREWIASLDATELERMHGLVAELRKDAPLPTRALLDAALGDPAFCDEDAGQLATNAAAQHAPILLWPVLYSIDDAAKIDAHLDKLANHSITTAIERLPDLVVRLGAAAAGPIDRILAVAMKNNYGSERVREAATALALIRTPQVASMMTRSLDHKDLRAIATEYLQNAPTLAVAPLAAQAIGRGAGADLARSVLRAVAAKAPEDARRIAETLSDAERGVVASALERFENLVEAEPSDLPRVLASPPWLEKKRQLTARVVKGVLVSKHAARIVWDGDAQATEFKNERSYYATDPTKEKSILKEIDDAQQAKRASAVASYKLLVLPKESAIRTLESAPLEIFSWYYGGVPHAFIGRYGVEAIPAVLRYATIDPTNAIEALAVASSPEVAPVMADALVRLKKSRQQAQAWLLRFPEAAAIGLIPAAVGEVGRARTAAEAALRFLAARGKSDVVRKVATDYGAEASAALTDVLEFDPLLDFPAKLPKLPGFFSPAALPRPSLRGQKKVLPIDAVTALAAMLAFSRIDEPYAGIAQVQEACEPSSLADFAWELFQAWLVAGAPSKEQWAFLALGYFGNDESARKLTPLIRAWPGEAAHARAVIGLDVLAAIGTDVALMHLHGIAQKVKFKGLQERARQKIDQIAEARGLTAEELGDRLVPDLGLEEDGSLLLDFGPRKFKVTFDESLKPAVLDESGKRLGDLPKPNKSDDAEKAAEAVATWKALKKDSKTVASSQLLRLELAMCSQRRWSQEVFDQFLVQHPLLVHLVRRLVWGAYDPKTNALVSSFRVVEDKSFADPKDARYELAAGATVGIAHRLEMKDTDAAAWGQVIGDYEIMQPFAQLSRQAATPTADEREGTEIKRVEGLKVPTGKVLGLDHNGWRRGPPQDGGVVCWYEKPVGDGFVACLDLDPGIFTGMVSEAPEQKLGKCVVAKNADYWRRENTKKLGELSPIQFSELLRDLESLRS